MIWRIVAIVGLMAGTSCFLSTGAYAEQEGPIVVRVVYDANNNSAFDAGDLPVAGATVGFSPSGGSGASLTANTGDDGQASGLSLAPGSFVVTAVGPHQLPGDSPSVCRGWRDTFVLGVASATAAPGGFGFVVDTGASAGVNTITIGISDRTAKDSGAQQSDITCPSPGGGDLSLPATGSGGPSAWPASVLALGGVFLMLFAGIALSFGVARTTGRRDG